MTKPTIAATPLSCNDISSLVHLFETSFHYHCQQGTSLADVHLREYLKNIRTVVGLGFTATLVEGDLVPVFFDSLNAFILHQSFQSNPRYCNPLAQSLVDMVSLGNDFFRCLGHPRYYQDFLTALRGCITHMTVDLNIHVNTDTARVLALIQG